MNNRLRVQLLRPDTAARDAVADALLRFENAELYREQSAATVAGYAAPFPQRAPLSMDGVRADFDKLFGVAQS